MNNKRKIRYFLGKLLHSLVRRNKDIYKRLSFTKDVSTTVGDKELFFHCHNEVVSNTIFYTGVFGDFEGETLRLWHDCILKLQPKLILDIGAFTGIYSLLAALLDKTSKIYAFEPNPITFELLEKNIRLNSFSNVHSFNYGVSTFSGEQTFYNWGERADSGMSIINHQFVEKDLGEVTLKVKNSADIRTDANQKIDLIKMDIERAELPILIHAKEYIKKDRPVIFCEVLDKKAYKEFDIFFNGLDYNFIKIDDKNKHNFHSQIMADESVVGMNWIFYPAEKKEIFN